MLSILNPEAGIDPKLRKRITRLFILAILCSVGTFILSVIAFLGDHPPVWVPRLLPLAVLIDLFLSGKVYRLRNPRLSPSS